MIWGYPYGLEAPMCRSESRLMAGAPLKHRSCRSTGRRAGSRRPKAGNARDHGPKAWGLLMGVPLFKG